MPTEDRYDVYIRFLIDELANGNTLKALDALETHYAEFEERIKSLKKESAEYTTIAERLTRTSTQLLAVGTGTVGGIFALAGKYVKDAKEATETTEAWEEANKRLQKSGQRAGAVLAEAALPLLEKAAQLAV